MIKEKASETFVQSCFAVKLFGAKIGDWKSLILFYLDWILMSPILVFATASILPSTKVPVIW